MEECGREEVRLARGEHRVLEGHEEGGREDGNLVKVLGRELWLARVDASRGQPSGRLPPQAHKPV